jgi:RNA polymerase sigma-70 factor (ECF subfamily)
MTATVGERDDAALVQQARGEPGHAAFRELYERHKDDLFTFVARLVRDDALAEDACQEAFLRAHRSLADFDSKLSFRGWLFEIARNAAIDALRRRAKQERLAEHESRRPKGAEGNLVLLEVARREATEDARSALDDLPDETRALLLQRHAHGLRLTELADSFACTERTIRNRLRAAAVLLTQALIERRARGGRP